MNSLNVFIEIKGIMTKIGTLSGKDYHDTVFTYDSDYLASANAAAISISLPLQPNSFSPLSTRCFFESLLPEGFSRRSIANLAKIEEDDYISLLEHLGKECIGAIQITKEDTILENDYILMSDNELRELAREGATKSTEIMIESHISLAGASGKVGLYYDETSNQWYKPYGTSASTHIVKQSHVRLNHLVLNEQLCMLTASKLGISVPKSFIIKLGNTNDEEMLYAIERYDRIKKNNKGKICSPYRLHQEDFAQALGILAKDKYELENRKYLKKMFDLINDYSSNPIEDGLLLWDRIVFNYLIGNMDAHIKNYGLIYSNDLKTIRLSPAYDIVCTRIYGNRNDMSVMINGHLDCTELSRESFVNASKELLIGSQIAMNRFDYLSKNLESALKESITEMKRLGYDGTIELGDRILKACNLAQM